MEDATGRRHLRYRVQIPVDVRIDRRWATLVTEDVGTGGLFVRADKPPAARQLVPLRIELPATLGAFKANGVIVRTVPAGSALGNVPGMALAFYGIGRPEQDHWERFLQHVAQSSPGSSEKPLTATRVAATPPGALRTRSPDVASTLEVTLAELEDLFLLYSRDVSRGGIFLVTDEPLATGSEVALRIVHAPSQTLVWLRSVVRRNVQSRGSRGVGVDLVMDEDEQRTLRRSLNHLIEAVDDEVAASTRLDSE